MNLLDVPNITLVVYILLPLFLGAFEQLLKSSEYEILFRITYEQIQKLSLELLSQKTLYPTKNMTLFYFKR